MNGIFDTDGRLYWVLTKITDCCYLSLLFFITSIPIITIGVSLTSLYYTVHKVIMGDRAQVGKEYFRAFRKNFKQGTILWMILLILVCVFWADIRALGSMFGNEQPIWNVLYVAGLLMVLIWGMYMFAYLARFEDSVKTIMKNTAVMLVIHFPQTILIVLLMLAMAIALNLFNLLFAFVTPVLGTIALHMIFETVFQKYAKINTND